MRDGDCRVLLRCNSSGRNKTARPRNNQRLVRGIVAQAALSPTVLWEMNERGASAELRTRGGLSGGRGHYAASRARGAVAHTDSRSPVRCRRQCKRAGREFCRVCAGAGRGIQGEAGRPANQPKIANHRPPTLRRRERCRSGSSPERPPPARWARV